MNRTSRITTITPSLTSFYQGKRVWVSGHTGFKGSWLTKWLLLLGAKVHGYALVPETDPSLFDQLELEQEEHLTHQVADVRDFEMLKNSLKEFRPEVVFHLAAQPLVRRSYRKPLETYQTNVMGTVNLLEALRVVALEWDHHVSAVMITTDKCYRNEEQAVPFTEEDPLGGKDPYSSSKAMDELAIEAYQRSYFSQGSSVSVASVRAGNVLGGGDWAEDRILPDAIRALQQGAPIPVRNPDATRPWQHVLEPLSGYLWLALKMKEDPALATAFNFGPESGSHTSVGELIEKVLTYWPGSWLDQRKEKLLNAGSTSAEATYLSLSIEKAVRRLEWKPLWNVSETIEQTMLWYRFASGEKLSEPLPFACSPSTASIAILTEEQIYCYAQRAHQVGRVWAQ